MIGYYVHHHGSGHAQRFGALRAQVPALIGLGSGPRPAGVPQERWVALPHDAGDGAAVDPTAGGALHWAPLREPRMTARTGAIARWVAEERPELLVIDVSVEVALTARLLAVPTVVIAQHGARTDLPHELAYRSAARVAALWPAGAHPDPGAAGDRLRHVGLISRFDARPPPPEPAGPGRRALLMLGDGGHDLDPDAVRASLRVTEPAWTWDVLGPPELGGRRADAHGVWAALGAAHVVVGPASNNCIAEAAAARRPFVALPQRRPFGEQEAHAEVLEAAGLAEVARSWPDGDALAGLLERAVRRGGEGWSGYHDGRGAQRLAAVLAEAVAR